MKSKNTEGKQEHGEDFWIEFSRELDKALRRKILVSDKKKFKNKIDHVVELLKKDIERK